MTPAFERHARATVSNVACEGNGVGLQCSAFQGSPAQILVADGRFVGNQYAGARIHCFGANLVRVQCDDTKEGEGASICYATASDATVSQCSFSRNRWQGLYSWGMRDVLIERSRFQGNSSWAAQFDNHQSVLARNNVVTRNASGVYLADGGKGIRFFNNTVVGCTNPYAVCVASGLVEVRNNIIANNGWFGLTVGNGKIEASNNLVFGHANGTDYWQPNGSTAPIGPGSIQKSPRFLSETAGDYRLAKGSPAINSGAWLVGSVDDDLDGAPRPKFRAFEIGAYEHADPSGSVRIVEWNEAR